MTIYIENFLIQNIIINFCLLRLTFLTTKLKSSIIRLIIASIIGSAFSVIVAVFINSNLFINILKFICAIIMLKTAFSGNFKNFISSLILLFLYTFAFGGAIMSISANTYISNFGIITSSKFSLEIICFIIIAMTYLVEKIAINLKNKIKINNYIYQVTLMQGKTKLSINAFLDTGNLLNIQGRPVIILDIQTYLKLTNTNIVEFYLKKTNEIETKTVTGNDKLKLFEIDCLKIKTKNKVIEIKNQPIAVNTNLDFKNQNYNALLSPLLL